MNKIFKLIFPLLIIISCLFGYQFISNDNNQENISEVTISEEGKYTSKEDVALYLRLYNHLPSNYITKTQAKKLGWDSEKGNLWEVTDHMSIGGGPFQNLEGLLPTNKEYKECDINYQGKDRGSERIVYSNDGYIYYTDDHYESFELLYKPE